MRCYRIIPGVIFITRAPVILMESADELLLLYIINKSILMETKIQSLHFSASAGLHDRVLEETEKLKQIHDRIQDCTVTLKLDKNKDNRNKVVEINLHVPGKHLFCEDRSESFETASDLAFAEIKRQLRKYKTTLANRKSIRQEND